MLIYFLMGLLVTALKEESHFSLDLNGIFGVVFVWIFHGIFQKSEIVHEKNSGWNCNTHFS